MMLKSAQEAEFQGHKYKARFLHTVRLYLKIQIYKNLLLFSGPGEYTVCLEPPGHRQFGQCRKRERERSHVRDDDDEGAGRFVRHTSPGSRALSKQVSHEMFS